MFLTRPFLAVCSSLLVCASAGIAQVILPDIPPRPSPPPTVPHGALILKEQRITGRIEATHAKWRVSERLQNPASHAIEAVYLRPIPKGAVARGLALIVDGKRMNGEILDAEKAAAVYREIVARMKDPALLEHVGDGLLRASVFPIPAQGCVEVEIDLEGQPEDLGCGILEFALPQKHVVDAGAIARFDLELIAERRIDTIYSPTHDAAITRESSNRARIRYEGAALAREFRLYFSADSEPGGLRVLTHRAQGEDGHFLLIHEPDTTANSEVAPRDVVFVIDRSGSMAGEKWTQATKALRFGIDTLRDGDRFAIVSFATDVRVHPGALTLASDDTRRAAKAHLDSLSPQGGTNISEALATSLPLFDSPSDRLPCLAFVTDGLPTVGETDVGRIVETASKANARSVRVFAFGVGYDVHTLLLDQLAAETRADSTYVAPNQDLELPLSAFFAKIAHPALTAPELSIRGDGIEAWALEPQRLPDLFVGDALRIAGRYRGAGPATFVLSGTRGGKLVAIEKTVDLPASENRNAFLPGSWAARRIGNLLQQIRRNGAPPELVDEVSRLGREHGIVTPYTAGLVVEDSARQDVAAGEPKSEAPSAPASADLSARGSGFASAPAVGEAAVERSRELKKLASGDAGRLATAAAKDSRVRVLGGYTMEKRSSTWVDRRFEETMRPGMKEIVAFSTDYFALLSSHPDLAEALALGADLILVVDGKAIRILPPA